MLSEVSCDFFLYRQHETSRKSYETSTLRSYRVQRVAWPTPDAKTNPIVKGTERLGEWDGLIVVTIVDGTHGFPLRDPRCTSTAHQIQEINKVCQRSVIGFCPCL